MKTSPNLGLVYPNVDTDAFDELVLTTLFDRVDALLGTASRKAYTPAADITITVSTFAAIDTTNLRVPITVPAALAGYVDVEIDAYLPDFYNLLAGAWNTLSWLKDGAEVTGNTYGRGLRGSATVDSPAIVHWRDPAPAAGLHNYDLAAAVYATSTGRIPAGSTIELVGRLVPKAVVL